MTGPGPLGFVCISALFTFLSIPAARSIARATGFVALPRADRIHRVPTPLLGGVACVLGIAAALALGSILPGTGWFAGYPGLGHAAAAHNGDVAAGAGRFPAAAVAAGAAAFFLLGLWDDRNPLPALAKGAGEGVIFLAVVLLWKPEGHLSTLPARVLLWVVAMVLVNAWNYIDHADGLFALNAFAASSILYLASPRLGLAAEPVPLLASVAGACVGFFLWNRPPARIFLGDAGSLVLGFILVAVALWRVDGGGTTALPGSLGAHGVVIADFLLVTVARWKRGANPFKGGCEHSGHRLSARLGGGVALVVFAIVNALLALIVGSAGPAHPAAATAGLALCILSFAWISSRLAPPRQGQGAR